MLQCTQRKPDAAAPTSHCTAALQVVCLDKMDYVASLNNLADIADRPNYKVSLLLLRSSGLLLTQHRPHALDACSSSRATFRAETCCGT